MLADGSKVESPMTYSSGRGERLILADPMDPRRRQQTTIWDHISAALNDSELLAIAVICAFGLLATLALCVLFPSFGALATSLQALL
jgi:hypothetical protein